MNCLGAGATGLFLILLWQTLTVQFNYGGNWTGLFCTGDKFEVPPELEGQTYRYRGTAGYDGQFYRYLAHDPLLTRGFDRYMDYRDLRARRILVPALAWIAVAGHPAAIDFAYIAVVALSLAAGVYWTSRIFVKAGVPALAGLGFLLLPGSLVSTDRMLVDGVLAAIFVGFVLYVEEGARRNVYVLCVLASLTRETGFILPLSVVAASSMKRDWRSAALFSSSMLPAVGWFVLVGETTTPRPVEGIVAFIPGFGVLRRLFEQRSDLLLKVTDSMALVGLIACLVLAWILAARSSSLVFRFAVGAFVFLGSVLGTREYLIEPYSFARPVAPLLVFVFLSGFRFHLWPAVAAPLMVSVGVGVSFLWQIAGIIRAAWQ